MKNILKDITASSTLSGEFYKSKDQFQRLKEQIFSTTWQWVGDASWVKEKNDLHPFILLENVLDEPLLLTNNGSINCISNVCTHRGKILVENPKKSSVIGCGYHGRCFSLDGKFKSMPEFTETKNFPTEKDNLTQIKLANWLNLLFVSLNPKFDFIEAIKPIEDRVLFLPLNSLEYHESYSKTYNVKANWALYVDNYLEGFHVPYIHPALKNALDFKNYDYELFKYCNLQIGVAKENEPHFEIPKGHVDFGKKIYAYYFWLFPNIMFNFYPWGLSLNYIQPIDHENTKITFRSYRFKNNNFDFEANNIDSTELEDEAVVESVQKGIKSRFYSEGRFSPTMEKCVHHFHQLVKEFALQ